MFSEPETDLLDGAPQWWAPYAQQVIAGGERLGFVYGFDGAWKRADYDLYDGFAAVIGDKWDAAAGAAAARAFLAVEVA